MTVSTPLRYSFNSSIDVDSRSMTRISAPRVFKSLTSGFDAEAGRIAAITCWRYGICEKDVQRLQKKKSLTNFGSSSKTFTMLWPVFPVAPTMNTV